MTGAAKIPTGATPLDVMIGALENDIAALRKQNDALVEALYTALNTETAARIGSESGAMQGLVGVPFDYKYHYDKIRTALRLAQEVQA